MTIERDPPFYWDIYCDHDDCSEEERISVDEAPEFRDVVKELKSRGWKVVPNNGGWDHLCPTCVEKVEARC